MQVHRSAKKIERMGAVLEDLKKTGLITDQCSELREVKFSGVFPELLKNRMNNLSLNPKR